MGYVGLGWFGLDWVGLGWVRLSSIGGRKSLLSLYCHRHELKVPH